jgi:adenosylcobinamide-phosphate synthase
VVGPLLWGALAGTPGVVGYRIVNTLDAMVGHHSERYERFGFAAARLDDLAGLLPARLTAGLGVMLAGRIGGTPAAARLAWRRDAAAHPSPNAGPCEAAFAGALGVRLGGPTVYPYGLSKRPWQGDGRDPDAADVVRAANLSRDVTLAAAVLCAAVALMLDALLGRSA